MSLRSLTLFFFLGLGLILSVYQCMPSRDTIDFNTQIRPILNEHCLPCHGGVKQSGGFSLLFEEDAFAETNSGIPAIVPGHPQQSELIKRIEHEDAELRMPLDKDALSVEEVDLLKKWIKEGAKWAPHWAYIAPLEQALPKLTADNKNKAKHPIDHFVFTKLADKGLAPSPQADCKVLINRLSLDIIGLPATETHLNRFCKDPSDKTYQIILEELLASNNFGEHWAVMWLDLARYADTKGYERDPHRDIWRYRDWLINALNEDMPFDQFTIEQLAGDLLPNPKPENYIATAFHRNTMNNDEGGTDNEEYRIAAVIDRVNTTWEVWQGTSFSCVQCHSHPYDPFRHEEYYQFYDFFNQSADADVYYDTPVFRFFEGEDSVKLEEIKNWINNLEEIKPEENRHYLDFLRITEPKIHPHTCDSLTNGALADTKFLNLYEGGYTRMPEVNLDGQKQLLVHLNGATEGSKLEFRLNALNGPLLGVLKPDSKKRGYQVVDLDIDLATGTHKIFVQLIHPSNPEASCSINWFLFFDGLPGKDQPGFNTFEENYWNLLDANTERIPIMRDQKGEYRRTTKVFHRGSWQDQTEKVEAGLPKMLPQIDKEASLNRLDLAEWLVSGENPLTARVMVNRVWAQLFGRGIVETLEDFGTMGTKPSHPQLLDWLALNFREDLKWSFKELVKQIVSSAAYQQSSVVSSEHLSIDPQNIWLARGPRVRLSAEQLRDKALAVSGLLSGEMYGPSVMPPQPDGVWQVVYSGESWKTSEGPNRYRRALYTYMRRTSPYPSFISFDAPSREVCTSRRINTNTPLQALVTLNDAVYLEAAIHLGKQALQDNDRARAIRLIYEKALLQAPSEEMYQTLEAIFKEAQAYYQKNKKAKTDFLSQAAFEIKEEERTADLVAMSLVANTILNLDAFVTKE